MTGIPFLTHGGEMGGLIAGFDWAAGPVGAPASWPGPLRTAVSIMLESRHPMLVWWGPDFTMFYNDAFMALAGDKHPGGLGSRGEEMFAEIWPTIGPTLRTVRTDGSATWVDDQRLLMNRRGFAEETYWTYSYSPIRDDDGRVLGVFTATNDTTARVLDARRLITLRALGAVSGAQVSDPDRAAAAVLDALAGNPADLPFAAVCLGLPGEELRIAASYGVTAGSPVLDAVRDRNRSVHRALRTGRPVVSRNLRERFPCAFPARADAPGTLGPDSAVVLPLVAPRGAHPYGALVVGTSPYRPLDEDYRAFLDLVAGQVTVAIGDAHDLAAERRRGEALAERHRRDARAELERSEAAFRLLAEHADDVIGRHDLDGTWRYVTPSVERVLGYRPQDVIGANPLDVVHPDDHAALAQALAGVGEAAPMTVLNLRLRHADGRFRWFELGLRRVRDSATGVAELHSSHRDITERLLAQEELARFRELTERSADFIGISDAAGVALSINPTGRRMIGIAPDRPATDIAIRDCVPAAAHQRFAVALSTAEREGSWTGPMDFVDSAGTSIPMWQEIVAHRDVRGHIAFYSTVAQDLRERMRGDEAIYEERERYRSLVAQVSVGIWLADATGVMTFANEHVAQLVGRTPAELVRRSWADDVHREDRAEALASWAAAVAVGEPWQQDYRLVRADGETRDVTSSARALHGADGSVTGFLGTTVDVTGRRRAEVARREAAAENAARKVSDAAAARLRAMVEGLAAIVWEAEWAGGRLHYTFVSDRAEELLGYPAGRLLAEPVLWPQLIHPDDRAEALAYSGRRTAAGLDHDLTYRAVAIDGRVVWLHQVVHVVTGPDGAPARVQGLAVDVTEQKRAERSAVLLADTGRLVADERTAEHKLAALARLLAHDLGDGAAVSLVGPDGLLRRVAVAVEDPERERALLAHPPAPVPADLLADLASGQPVVGTDSTLLAPLAVDGRVVGLLEFPQIGTARYHDRADLDLAAELGRRASMMLAADRRRTRDRQMQQVSAELASAGGVAEAAQRLVARLSDVLGAGAMSVFLVEPDRGIRVVHAVGYSAALHADYSTVRLDDPVPIAHAVRTGTAVWVRNRDEWRTQWPELLDHVVAGGRHAGATLPLIVAGRVVGTVVISFPTPREFPADERGFVMAMVAQAAPAFERAAVADERRMIAETLQRSLLPPALPELDRLALAARYLPGAQGTQAGGDWYDVLPLDDPATNPGRAAGRVAVVVGDVVGQGARAAAIMGQLRSALSAYLLEGHGPLVALEHLDRFAGRVPGAAGSTVACLVLDPGTGDLTWASAGHLPPLVVGPAGARYLDDAAGTVLGVRGRPEFRPGQARIAPGESIVVYTDGLVERRGEVVDDGLARLAAAAAASHGAPPEELADALLAQQLDVGPADDVALIVARLVPAPLRLELPALADQLRTLRRAVQGWAATAGLREDDLYDLQLALGEAAANSVEHAYRDLPPGTMGVELARQAGPRIAVRVRDGGSWRPEPDDKGHRGRGLSMIYTIGSNVSVLGGQDGTEVRFEVLPRAVPGGRGQPRSPTAGPTTGPTPPPAGPTRLRFTGAGGTTPVVEVLGDLDIAGVGAIRDELLATAGRAGLVVDLTATTYLASAGVALLVATADAARAAGTALRLVATPGGIAARMLALSGVEQVVEVLDVSPAGPRE